MKDEFAFEAKFYDKIWGRYDYDTDVKFLDALFRRYKCQSVLDVGCGTGNHAMRLSRIGYEVTGVDISTSMLKIAKGKDEEGKIRFLQGDMRKLEKIIPKGQRFDAAICLGQVFSNLTTEEDVRTFLKQLHNVLKENGIFVFNVKNAKTIRTEYLDKLCLDHMINEEGLQLLILTYNTLDSEDPDIIVWRPIYLINENGKVNFQIREHKLKRFRFSRLKEIMSGSGFNILAIYSGPRKEEFRENEDDTMWFVTEKR
ncbi:MAG: class I SAM-dependent methyltransferase [Candidatus Bathyarchaeia archaeon]